MKVTNMRWGYTGTVYCCGPMEGDTLVETQVKDEDGQDVYVLMSRMGEFCQVNVSREPLFEIAMNIREDDSNIQKLQDAADETYDFERESDDPEDYDDPEDLDEEDIEEIPHGIGLFDCPEMYQSRFKAAIILTLKASESCYALDAPTDEDAAAFVKEYLGKDIETVEIDF